MKRVRTAQTRGVRTRFFWRSIEPNRLDSSARLREREVAEVVDAELHLEPVARARDRFPAPLVARLRAERRVHYARVVDERVDAAGELGRDRRREPVDRRDVVKLELERLDRARRALGELGRDASRVWQSPPADHDRRALLRELPRGRHPDAAVATCDDVYLERRRARREAAGGTRRRVKRSAARAKRGVAR